MPSNARAMRKAGPITSAGWPNLPPGATPVPTPSTAAPARSDCPSSLAARSSFKRSRRPASSDPRSVNILLLIEGLAEPGDGEARGLGGVDDHLLAAGDQ